MKVEQLMARDVHTCGPDDTLNAAARLMWEHDCGCVPIVEPDDGGLRIVGMLTDRDVCMAAYTQGRPLAEISVKSAMAQDVRSCRLTDSLATALKVLEQNQLHRLPVVDASDHLIGVLSVTDVVREASREHARSGNRDVTDVQVAEALEGIKRPRQSGAIARAA